MAYHPAPQPAAPSDDELAREWIGELDASENDADRQLWVRRCKAINLVYKDKRAEAARTKKRFALFWSNIETLKPAVYARTPTAVVTRRFKDADPVGRVASEILERSLNFSLVTGCFSATMLGTRDEFLLFARGQAWARYVPTMRTEMAPAPPLPPPVTTEPAAAGPVQVADDAASYEVVDWEEVRPDRVHWEDFFTNVARSWAEVRWAARRVFMTRKELVKRFPECGAEVPLDWAPENADATEAEKKAAVYEIWDLVTKTVYWISRGYPHRPLDSRPDPLKLKDFFPCPRPVLGTVGSDSLIPVPDYTYYQDQLDEIDVLTARIDKLIDALRVRGFYSSAEKANLNTLLSGADNVLIPIDSWAALGDKGGVKGLIEWFPLEQIAGALKECFAARKQVIEDVFQITGISDIQRGDTDPDETAAAQKLKSIWGSSRVRDRQKELARFARDLLQIMGEVIAGKFGQDTLSQMTGVQLMTDADKAQVQQQMAVQQQAAQAAQQMGQPAPPMPPIPPQVQQMLAQPSWEDVLKVLRSPSLRAFHIDIETDSTIEPNDTEDKARRIEFVQAVGKYLADSLPVVQAAPALLPVIVQGLMFLVRGFRVGREMEDVIETAMQQLQAQASAPQTAKPPDPVEQAKATAAQTTAQAHMVQAQNAGQANQIEAARLASQHQLGMADVQAENQRTQAELEAEMHQTLIREQGRHLMHEITAKPPPIGGVG